MTSIATNYYPTQNGGQGFPLPPPPSKLSERKLPESCFLSYIDQVADGFYSSSKLVRNEPRKTSDTYFLIKTRKTSVGSFRRNYSHRNVSLFKTKKGGPTRANIAYMTCSFLELDGTTDNSIKSLEDVLALISKNNLPTASYVDTTSLGNFHILWNYTRPLPFTSKGESFWISQQKRLIQLFEKGGFLVDKGASLNPTQNLRNPSQLNPYNFKRRCEVHIHRSYQKTSLRAIFKALNGTNIPNPRPIPASVKLRRFLRANKTFTLTHAELAITLGTSLSTAERIVKRVVQNGDLRIVARTGNNKRITRATRYRSTLYIELQFSEPSLVRSKTNFIQAEVLLRDFQAVGAKKGWRQKTLFALGLEIKSQLGKTASLEAIRAELEGGAMRSHVPEKEFERTLRNIMKPEYNHPFSLAKLRGWDLIQEINHFH